MKKILAYAVAAMLLPAAVANAQLFTSDLDSAEGWGLVADDDTSATFGFDYSPFGIPAAPNGTGTTGLAMSANITSELPDGGATVSAYPIGLDLSGQYQVKVDFWLNYNSSGGTTESGGASVGFDATAGTTVNGATFLGNTDGDSSRDYQLFADGTELLIESGAYSISSQNHTAEDLQAQFPADRETPAAQGAAPFDPTNVIVQPAAGTLGYAWHTLTIDVDTDAGTAVFSLDDGFEIGTVSGADLSGGLALSFQDQFGSVSNKPEFSFGVFDNLVVTQVPEPGALTLLASALLGLAGYRRRR